MGREEVRRVAPLLVDQGEPRRRGARGAAARGEGGDDDDQERPKGTGIVRFRHDSPPHRWQARHFVSFLFPWHRKHEPGSGRSPIFVFGFSSSFRTWHVWQNDGTWHEAQRFCPCEAYIECSRMNTIEWRKVSYGLSAPVETFSWHSRQSTLRAASSSGCFGGTDSVWETIEQPMSMARATAPATIANAFRRIVTFLPWWCPDPARP